MYNSSFVSGLLAPLPAPPPPPPPPDPNAAQCRLLGPTALIVQALMGVMVISSLVLKRQLEKRKRKWRVWVWDVSKQLVGQAVVHTLNLLISDLVAHAADNNPCSLYFLNILIDTTIGVAIFYFALKGYTWLFATHLRREGYISGQYGSPPQPRYWWNQLQPYLLAIVTMKLIVLLPLTLPRISASLIRFGQSLLRYLAPDVQVVFVLALFPLIMNVFQFCVVDQLIKAGKGIDDKLEHGDDEEEGGDTGANADECDDDGGYRPVPTRDIEATAGAVAVARGEPRRRNSNLKRFSSMDTITSVPSAPSSPLLAAVIDDRRGAGSSVSAAAERMSRTPPSRDYGSTSPRHPGTAPAWSPGAVYSALVSRASGDNRHNDLAPPSSPSVLTRSRRSGAPSPPDPDMLPPSPTANTRTVNAAPVNGSVPLPPPPPPAFNTVSRLSMEAQRDARRELSPPREMRRSLREEGMGLHEV